MQPVVGTRGMLSGSRPRQSNRKALANRLNSSAQRAAENRGARHRRPTKARATDLFVQKSLPRTPVAPVSTRVTSLRATLLF